MALTTFTAAQVLTAAQLNAVQANDYNQTVSTKTASYTLVAADKGTRVVMNVASGNTVTVNTSLFTAGDTLVIQNIGAGVTTVTAGTATVSSAGPLTISQYGSGTLYFTSAGVSLWFPSAGPAASSGLTYVGGGNLSSSSTTFSNVFSATYDNYRIVMSEIFSVTSQFYLLFTLGAANSNYTYEKMYALPGTAWTNQASSASTTHIHFADVGDSYYSSVTMDLQSPFVSQTTTLYAMNSGYSNSHYMTVGAQKSTSSFTAFTVASNGGETFTGKVRVYGLANS